MSIIVADASPLIALATINRLELLAQLYESVWIPQAVKQELRLDSEMPGSKQLKQAISAGWLHCKPCEYPQHSYQQLSLILDQGEVEAILLAESLAQQEDYRFLLIDELKGRNIALNRGLLIAGSGTVLLAAKKKRYIESVERELEAMLKNGYRLSKALRVKLLQLAGER